MNALDQLDAQRSLIERLVLRWEKEYGHVQLFETHISWVVVAGEFAYKFKKPVRFDFLDFSSLASRHFYCQEELRLNRRLAPDLYLDVVAVTGDPGHPVLDQNGPPLAYAVKMRAFAQEALWNNRIRKLLISPREIDDLALRIAAFHQAADRAAADMPWGTPEAIFSIADENFATLSELVQTDIERQQLSQIKRWESGRLAALSRHFIQRKAAGFVRECHGDLHGANIITLNGRVEAFDCIEFNEGMRWIDVMNDLAFPSMDLRFQGRPDLAVRLLNHYLEITGDFGGLAVLRYYQTHRALVRSKVALLRAKQLSGAAREESDDAGRGRRYLAFAAATIQSPVPAILITRGYSGSGKSTLAGFLAEGLDAIRLRSDAERKRLHGLPVTVGGLRSNAAGLYDPASTHETYQRLATLARYVVEAGYLVIVDATFLRQEQRQLFADLAAELGVPFFILDVQASEATMRARLAARTALAHDLSDADGDVLNVQLAQHDPLCASEAVNAICVDLDVDIDATIVARLCQSIFTRLGT